VLTAPFYQVLERHLTHWRPERPFPTIIIEHPIQNVPEEHLLAQARAMVKGALAFLPPA